MSPQINCHLPSVPNWKVIAVIIPKYLSQWLKQKLFFETKATVHLLQLFHWQSAFLPCLISIIILCYQEELETTIHWILDVLKISGWDWEPSRQMRVWPPVDSARVRQTRSKLRFALTMTLSSVSLSVWSMVGALRGWGLAREGS